MGFASSHHRRDLAKHFCSVLQVCIFFSCFYPANHSGAGAFYFEESSTLMLMYTQKRGRGRETDHRLTGCIIPTPSAGLHTCCTSHLLGDGCQEGSNIQKCPNPDKGLSTCDCAVPGVQMVKANV